MLIIGAKGFAKEVLEVLHQLGQLDHLAFFDNVSTDIPDWLYDRFPVIRTLEEAATFFRDHGPAFTLGLGGPATRYALCQKMEAIGGELTATISPFAHIGHFGNNLAPGSNIMTGSVLTNDIQLGKGCLINLNCTIGHDCRIGDFVEMSPGVHVSGNCAIGHFCNLGTNAVILPKVTLGDNVVVGAGAVVTKNVPDNSLVVGIPAQKIKDLEPLYGIGR